MRAITLLLCAIDALVLGLAVNWVWKAKAAPPTGTWGDLLVGVLGYAVPPVFLALFLLTVLPALLLALADKAPKFALTLALVTPALLAAGMVWLSS